MNNKIFIAIGYLVSWFAYTQLNPVVPEAKIKPSRLAEQVVPNNVLTKEKDILGTVLEGESERFGLAKQKQTTKGSTPHLNGNPISSFQGISVLGQIDESSEADLNQFLQDTASLLNSTNDCKEGLCLGQGSNLRLKRPLRISSEIYGHRDIVNRHLTKALFAKLKHLSEENQITGLNYLNQVWGTDVLHNRIAEAGLLLSPKAVKSLIAPGSSSRALRHNIHLKSLVLDQLTRTESPRAATMLYLELSKLKLEPEDIESLAPNYCKLTAKAKMASLEKMESSLYISIRLNELPLTSFPRC